MQRIEKTAPPPGGEPSEFILSDGGIDRMGDIIEPKGWIVDKLQTQALFNHDKAMPIGRWTNVRVKGEQLLGKLEWVDSDYPLFKHIKALVDQGMLRTVSVGFQPLQSEPLDDERSGYRFLKQELLECSVVAVPANPRAVALAKSLGIPLRESASEGLPVHGKSADIIPIKGPKKMQTLSQQIKSAHDNFNALRDRLDEINRMEEPTDDDIQRADELPDEIEQAKVLIKKLEIREKALAPLSNGGDRTEPEPVTIEGKATRVKTSDESLPPRHIPFALAKKKTEPQDLMYRALACWAASEGSREALPNVLRERLSGSDREIIPVIIKAAANPALTTVAGWAQELTSTVNMGFLDRLLPTNIYSSLAAAGNRYTFDQYYQIKIPVRTATSTLAGAWVGEGAAKPVKKGSFTTVTLTPFKLAVISTFSEEMAQYSMPTIEGIIRQAMQDDTAITLDTFLIDNVAAGATRPAGLLNGVTPVTASAAATQAQKIIDDMSALYAAIVAAGGGSNVIYLMNPAQAIKLGTATAANGAFMFADAAAAAAKFNGRVIASTTIPAGRVIAIDAAEFATATGDAPRFAVSNEATLHEEDTTPLALSAAGTPNTVAAPMRSLFQTDAIAIRMTLYVTWAMRRTGMVQTIASVTW